MIKWNKRQRQFVVEYLIDQNATQAAIRAGYSASTAFQIGYELLKLVEIRDEIQKELDARAERTRVTADKVILELARIAFTDMKEFAAWADGQVRLKSSERLSEEQSRVVQEVSLTNSGPKIKLYDKVHALELLGKYLKLFNDKVDLGDLVIKVQYEEGTEEASNDDSDDVTAEEDSEDNSSD